MRCYTIDFVHPEKEQLNQIEIFGFWSCIKTGRTLYSAGLKPIEVHCCTSPLCLQRNTLNAVLQLGRYWCRLKRLIKAKP